MKEIFKELNICTYGRNYAFKEHFHDDGYDFPDYIIRTNEPVKIAEHVKIIDYINCVGEEVSFEEVYNTLKPETKIKIIYYLDIFQR